MRVLKPLLLLIALAVAALLWNRQTPAPQQDAGAPTPHATLPAANNALPPFLPPEAADTLARIAHGGPFEHRQDGVVFNNREGRLPTMPDGYYHEYTVDTPGLDYRGARRIITGGTPPRIYCYTDDHYRTFRPFEVSR
jgi:ribonuclease T1